MTEYLFRPIDLAWFVLGIVSLTSFLVWLFCGSKSPSLQVSKSLVIDVETFGPRLKYAELELLLTANPELVRAVQQVCVCRRERCQRAVEDKSNTLNGQTKFEAGAAAGMSDLMATLEMIRQGRADGDVKAWFGK